ncbi:Glycosyltransferase, catalytic subunit of cellulose synthase and poly-beta-1,6-N-acetylglucosamine synthase [Thermostaphylospora chromogena]|uniref:Glycosyltransferase, catalytic subunit of cellulose synthase and poly-beta-1,6-N-acetylglucosamine synthase n=2 Tax=Thermostaphylospora chromogena TaxID=35622 RepID=A0A1H1EHI2_9ACTN|nr:glycosyltransferase family 2 protein [Thermostaphylospora chromogena]SDQ88163.1 Glycosyltransferase, catalytic subunit of cellulose synthase and poly-beta-1,6-N-acetylglucosamine synthase [Thermostaphylospora chromogena]
MKQFPDSPAPAASAGSPGGSHDEVPKTSSGSAEAPAPSERAAAPSRSRTWPPISVIMPVLNEERHLREAVRQVLNQAYDGPIEVVLAVGPSRDRTQEVADALAAEDPRVTVVPNPTGRTPNALNAAIAASRHQIVARVDGHAMLPADYLKVAVETLEETGADNVGGIMAAEGRTPFECAVARAMTSKLGVGGARFHTGGEAGPADTVYLGVFRRSALDRVGGYDEHFLRAQDWEMNHRIRATGGLVWFQPRMRVSYRPRSTVRALAKQYFHYGRWRRVVAHTHQGTINMRYLAPPLAVLAMLAGVLISPFFWPGLLIPGAYAVGILAGSLVTGRGLAPAALVRLPIAYATMHISWGWGFLTSPRRLRKPAPAAGTGSEKPGKPGFSAIGLDEWGAPADRAGSDGSAR